MTALATPELPTARLRLRPFEDGDTGDLLALMGDAHVLRYWDAPAWTDPRRAPAFVDRCREMADEGSGVRPAVVDRTTGDFLGWLTLDGWDPTSRSASLGFCFVRRSWGRGVATEAVRALLDWAFGTLDLNRVQAEADTRNAPCRRVLEKLGFVLEGTLREDCVVDGVVSDSWVLGLLRRDRDASHP
ncbi:GNAT family N-acetyltransferase [Nocardioides sp. CFH 31398]|uniref:GNAT family N-acetyltransferase n=1 Tax=Nocardioides sp. CFH 31398 TaxID=2919579 RepID=UPI001F0557A4|nr:GNAT family N-acetyltransferase [Nocardioides sp. CFH 31398]MCH1866691.1 GNAT family N-acetyltransferase [Nocardioides sp. CFH 31398]